MDPVNIPAKLELRSFTHSWDNRGYWKNLGSPWVCPRTLFFQIFNRFLFAWMLWIYLSNLKFAALRVIEIIGGTRKNLRRPWMRPCSLFSQIFNRLLLAWTLWIYLPNLNFVALRVPEIKGGTGQITWWRHLWRHEACIDYPCGSFGRTI